VRQVDPPLLDQVLMHPLAVLARAGQPRGRGALINPKTATRAWVGQLWLSKVKTSITTSAPVRNWSKGVLVVAAQVWPQMVHR
jgi:hypothetical protein